MRYKDMIELRDYVMKRMSYDPETGVFTRISSFFNEGHRGVLGVPCGTLHHSGVYVVRLRKQYYQLHNLAWLVHYGELPRGDVYHLDGNKLNNKISNLAVRNKRSGTKNTAYNKKLNSIRSEEKVKSTLENLPLAITYIRHCTKAYRHSKSSGGNNLTKQEFRSSQMFQLVFKVMSI